MVGHVKDLISPEIKSKPAFPKNSGQESRKWFGLRERTVNDASMPYA